MNYFEETQRMVEFTETEWVKLCKEYKVDDVEFHLCSPITYTGYVLLYSRQTEITHGTLVDIFNDLTNGHNHLIAVAMAYYTFDEDDLIDSSNFAVLMSYESLCDAMMKLDFQIDRIKIYLRNVLKHEIGHILDYKSSFIIGKTRGEYFIKEQKLNQRNKRRYNKWINDNPDANDEIKLRKSHGRLSERRANKMVGLTWEDFLPYESTGGK